MKSDFKQFKEVLSNWSGEKIPRYQIEELIRKELEVHSTPTIRDYIKKAIAKGLLFDCGGGLYQVKVELK